MSENFEFESEDKKENKELLESIHEQWFDLVSNLGIEHNKAEKHFDNLVDAYNGPDRFYHNLEHINKMLKRIELFSGDIEDMSTLQLAIWYHDVVYDSHAGDNEEQSAKLAEKVLLELGLSNDKVEKIKDFIINTKEHEVSSEDSFDMVLLMDVDLEILGSSWEDFKKYRDNIRKEYAWVSKEEYVIATRSFLKNMLGKKKIYNTQLMHDKFEEQAKHNLERALKEL